MNQTHLYAAFRELRCEVLVFEDHPQFFGNWRADFKYRGLRYEIVGDNREGWLTLWHYPSENNGERIHEVEITRLDEADEISLLKDWVRGLPE